MIESFLFAMGYIGVFYALGLTIRWIGRHLS